MTDNKHKPTTLDYSLKDYIIYTAFTLGFMLIVALQLYFIYYTHKNLSAVVAAIFAVLLMFSYWYLCGQYRGMLIGLIKPRIFKASIITASYQQSNPDSPFRNNIPFLTFFERWTIRMIVILGHLYILLQLWSANIESTFYTVKITIVTLLAIVMVYGFYHTTSEGYLHRKTASNPMMI